jgi:hypothetical protein
MRWLRKSPARALAGAGIVLTALVAAAAPASAHTPVILSCRDVNPWTSPLVLNGTDPVALFGALPNRHSDRAAQFIMQSGDTINLALGMADEAPEDQLTMAQMPKVTLIAPDKQVTIIRATEEVPVSDPEIGLSVFFLTNYTAPAIQGTYSIIVTGRAPVRFFVALGLDPGTFHGVKRGQVATEAQVQQWFNTPAQEQCRRAR